MDTDDIVARVEPGPGWPGSVVPPLMFQIGRVLRTSLDRRMADHGLTFPQASLLIRCVRHPGISPSQLMPHLGTDNAGITRLADRLEAAGLAVRAGGRDRRSITLEPTAAGVALAPELEKVLGDTVRRLLSDLSEEEVVQLSGLLRRMMASVAELD